VTQNQRLAQVTLNAELQQAERSVRDQAVALEYAHTRMKDLETRHQSGLISNNELELSKQAVIQAQSNLDRARTEFEAITARRNIIETRDAALDQGKNRPVVYNIAELKNFGDDVARAVKAVAGERAKVQLEAESIEVSASPAQHAMVRDLLLTLRRIKTNNPDLQPAPEPEQSGDAAAPK
jgi:hypothetical protein